MSVYLSIPILSSNRNKKQPTSSSGDVQEAEEAEASSVELLDNVEDVRLDRDAEEDEEEYVPEA